MTACVSGSARVPTDDPPQPDPTGPVPASDASTASPASAVGLPLLLLLGVLVFALVSGGSFLIVPRLLDPGDPSSAAPAPHIP